MAYTKLIVHLSSLLAPDAPDITITNSDYNLSVSRFRAIARGGFPVAGMRTKLANTAMYQYRPSRGRGVDVADGDADQLVESRHRVT